VKTSKLLSQTIPPHDYRPAVQGALSWLGNRYLLAEPVNRRSADSKVQAGDPQRAQPSLFVLGAMS
jgi:hypothetical protein